MLFPPAALAYRHFGKSEEEENEGGGKKGAEKVRRE